MDQITKRMIVGCCYCSLSIFLLAPLFFYFFLSHLLYAWNIISPCLFFWTVIHKLLNRVTNHILTFTFVPVFYPHKMRSRRKNRNKTNYLRVVYSAQWFVSLFCIFFFTSDYLYILSDTLQIYNLTTVLNLYKHRVRK